MLRSRTFPALAVLALAAGGCLPQADRSGSQEVLTTEDVGGAIDAELSTDEDPRGGKSSETGLVLPPGFPAELPIPTSVTGIESRPREGGQAVVVLTASQTAERLALDWTSLLESEGWDVERSSGLALSARRGEQVVSATISGLDSGSRLRIAY